jgi:uncharacterized membrane protein YciS (DUF1049 family)
MFSSNSRYNGVDAKVVIKLHTVDCFLVRNTEGCDNSSGIPALLAYGFLLLSTLLKLGFQAQLTIGAMLVGFMVKASCYYFFI